MLDAGGQKGVGSMSSLERAPCQHEDMCENSSLCLSVGSALGVSESLVPKERPVCLSLKPSSRAVPLKVLSRRMPSADCKAAPGGAVEDPCGLGGLEVMRPMRNQESCSLTRSRAGTQAGVWQGQESLGLMNRPEGCSRGAMV